MIDKVGSNAVTLGAACLAFSRFAVPSATAGEEARSSFRIAAAKCEAERSSAGVKPR